MLITEQHVDASLHEQLKQLKQHKGLENCGRFPDMQDVTAFNAICSILI